MRIVFTAIFLMRALTLGLSATTYYVDFTAGNDANAGTATGTAWKRAPGMLGFTGSYSASAGDIITFKGGETWTNFPWTVAVSGAAASPIKFTTDRTWYSGGSFSKPIMDAKAREPAGGILQADTRSNLFFHDMVFTNYGTVSVHEGKKAVDFVDSKGITITGCDFSTYSWITIYFHWNAAGTHPNISVTSNTCQHTSSMLWLATAASGVTVDGVAVSWNRIFDFTSQLISDVHGDGFVHFFSVPSFQTTQLITNVVMEGNVATGDFRKSDASTAGMTAFFFNEATTSAKIVNNVFAPSPVQASMFEAYVVFSAANGGVVEMYNNTLQNSGPSSGLGINTGAVNSNSKLVVTNNIIDGFTYGLSYAYVVGTIGSDYNCVRSGSGQLFYDAGFQSYATWQGAGRDTHSVFGSDPLLANTNSDFRLQSGSPAKDVGVAIASRSADIIGTAVPQGAAPDIGAYEYVTPLSTYRGFSFGSGVRTSGRVTVTQ